MADTDVENIIADYLDDVTTALTRLPLDSVRQAAAVLREAARGNRLVLTAGNGGSAATASHMANDLSKGVAARGGKPCRAICLNDCVPLVTAIANDSDYSRIFSAQLSLIAAAGDLLLVVSGSGNSPNILRALSAGRDFGLRTIGLLGGEGGEAASLVDVAVIVPSTDYGVIEDVHLTINHILAQCLSENR